MIFFISIEVDAPSAWKYFL